MKSVYFTATFYHIGINISMFIFSSIFYFLSIFSIFYLLSSILYPHPAAIFDPGLVRVGDDRISGAKAAAYLHPAAASDAGLHRP